LIRPVAGTDYYDKAYDSYIDVLSVVTDMILTASGRVTVRVRVRVRVRVKVKVRVRITWVRP